MNPKLFVSYSWSSDAHVAWVIDLATQLREAGVDVILDKWDLKEGHDANAFMERMVTDPEVKKVALICDRAYVEKTDKRRGGVGTEAQIISAEVYAKVDQNKFVAVIAEKEDDRQPYRPTYYKSRIYIDLSDPDAYAKNLEQLLRWVYDKPLHEKPALGKPPAFLEDAPGPRLGTTVLFQRAINAIRNRKDDAPGAIREYFERFADELEVFRVVPGEQQFDDVVVANIERFLPYKNEVVELVLTMAHYRSESEIEEDLHRFVEHLFAYLFRRPADQATYTDWDHDVFHFIAHELYLNIIAALLKHGRFTTACYLMDQRYYVDTDYGSKMLPFTEIRGYLRSLEARNQRLKLRRLSLRADMLIARCANIGISQAQLMQADFVLFLRATMDALAGNGEKWWPETLLYAHRHRGPFEIFARAESKEQFVKLQPLFGEGVGKEQLTNGIARLTSVGELPRWEFDSFNPVVLANIELLATRR